MKITNPLGKTAVLSAGMLMTSMTVSAIDHTNFIIIFMDDMGYGDIANNGAIGYKTPNIDRMVNDGMLFTRFYAAQAVSGASRAGLMTGCYPNRINFHGAPGPTSTTGIHENEMTIAEVLKQKGYACAAFGKWHLGHHKQFLPTHNGFDEFYGIPYSNDMWPNHPTAKFPDLPLIEGDEAIEYNSDQTRFTTDFTMRSLKFIEKNKENPFFLYLAHPMPHVPLFVSNKFKGKSEQGLYGDVMMELDWSIGQILNKLEEMGIDENTLVVITSDNGPWLNYGNHAGTTGGLREGKGTSFEGGQRVPCVMQWKGKIPAGKICNELSSTIDLLPTFAAISEAPLPEHTIDGVNILSLMKGEENAKPRQSFCYYYRKNSLEAVTDGGYKLVFPHAHRSYEGFIPGDNGQPGKVNEYRKLEDMQLFDLRRDPGERYNVIDKYPEVVERLMLIAENAREEMGDDLTGREGRNRRPIGQLVIGSDK